MTAAFRLVLRDTVRTGRAALCCDEMDAFRLGVGFAGDSPQNKDGGDDKRQNSAERINHFSPHASFAPSCPVPFRARTAQQFSRLEAQASSLRIRNGARRRLPPQAQILNSEMSREK